MKQPNTLAEAAHDYALRGWPVLPLLPQSKIPATKHGVLDASYDVQVIDAYWSRWPNHNIGLRSGGNFDVLDIDGDVGRASLNAIAGPEITPSGPATRTGKGEHWFYAASHTANRANFFPKLDWRGINGFIVAPPSIHPDGHVYEWIDDHGPERPLLPAPEEIRKYLRPYINRIVITPNPYDDENDIVKAALETGHVVMRNGSTFRIRCPFHEGDNDPSMVLYPDSASGWCFGCNTWINAKILRKATQ